MGEHLPLLTQYEALFGSSSEMCRVLALIYADILSFHKRAVRLVAGKGDYPIESNSQC